MAERCPTLGNVRSGGVRELCATCRHCRRLSYKSGLRQQK